MKDGRANPINGRYTTLTTAVNSNVSTEILRMILEDPRINLADRTIGSYMYKFRADVLLRIEMSGDMELLEAIITRNDFEFRSYQGLLVNIISSDINSEKMLRRVLSDPRVELDRWSLI